MHLHHRRAPSLTLRSRTLKAALCLLVLGLLAIPTGAKASWWNGDWSYRKKITIDASPKGVVLPADAGRVPVLVRLHDGNFKFTDAKDDGSDIRFVDGDDKTPLKFHLDTFDSVLGIALVWVDIPAVKAGQTTDIWLYYGNANAPIGADPKGTYDPDTSLIYHFGEKDAPPRDETAYANNATAVAKTVDTGLIGRAAHFDGTAPLQLPASPSLVITQNGAFSWSAWVKADAIQPAAVLFAKHDGPNALTIGLEAGVPYVAVTNGAAPLKGSGTAAIAAATWHHIAVTASDHVTLYVDGKQAATVATALPALGGPGFLGGDMPPADTAAAPAVAPAAPGGAPAQPAPAPAAPAPAQVFTGDIDELAIAKVARSPGFIAAAFATQGAESAMVVYGQDEENAGLSGGYFGVILRSVTIDGWVVIGILGIMAAVSWIVMVNKALYIRRVTSANAAFLEVFTRVNGDVTRLRTEIRPEQKDLFERSVLYRVYQAVEAELARRAALGHGTLILTPQAVATIRANLDRASTGESTRLNSLMVLLTIAISGGPFLGLLGTVVGVMITFAAIAASGDVNVNAIAPGIAAALVATVAGLAVAIPALFGYNYLISGIKDVTSEMHGFVDELVTRLAETYSHAPEPDRLAAE